MDWEVPTNEEYEKRGKRGKQRRGESSCEAFYPAMENRATPGSAT